MSYSPADIVVGFNIIGIYISETTDDPVFSPLPAGFPVRVNRPPFDGW
jgi:hypothetical protein